MCNERYKWLGWVGLGGGTKVLLACSNANKTRKPQNQEKKNNRQQNNAVITVVTRTKIREKKKKKGNRDRVRCFSSSRGEVAVAVGAAPHNHHIW